MMKLLVHVRARTCLDQARSCSDHLRGNIGSAPRACRKSWSKHDHVPTKHDRSQTISKIVRRQRHSFMGRAGSLASSTTVLGLSTVVLLHLETGIRILLKKDTAKCLSKKENTIAASCLKSTLSFARCLKKIIVML